MARNIPYKLIISWVKDKMDLRAYTLDEIVTLAIRKSLLHPEDKVSFRQEIIGRVGAVKPDFRTKGKWKKRTLLSLILAGRRESRSKLLRAVIVAKNGTYYSIKTLTDHIMESDYTVIRPDALKALRRLCGKIEVQPQFIKGKPAFTGEVWKSVAQVPGYYLSHLVATNG